MELGSTCKPDATEIQLPDPHLAKSFLFPLEILVANTVTMQWEQLIIPLVPYKFIIPVSNVSQTPSLEHHHRNQLAN